MRELSEQEHTSPLALGQRPKPGAKSRGPPQTRGERAAPRPAREPSFLEPTDKINLERKGPVRDSNLNGDGPRLSLVKLDNAIPNDVRECATLYAGMGLSIVPNQRGRKRPTVKGWPELRISSDEVSDYFEEGENIGVLMGEPSGGLVDIDLDCQEARAVANRFLPDTLTSGRKNAPRSHRFFVSPGAKSRSWRVHGKDGKTLIESRSTGAQTLVEPSIHPTGDRYEWDRDGVPEAVEIAAEQLEVLCSKIATAAMIARRLPAEGRHHFAMALAGYLLQLGRLDEETTREVLLAAWHAAGADSREALDDVERIVRDTAEKIASGEAVVGGPTLEELVPGLVGLLSQWWGWQSSKGAVTNGNTASDDKPTEDELRDRWIETRERPTAYGQSEWRRYSDGFWTEVHEQIINLEIDDILVEAKPEGIRPTSGMRSSVGKLAQAKMFVPHQLWDANEDVLVCRNGTLEISSSILREHRPEDYALGAVPYDFNPDAHAPVFYDFLMSTIPVAAPFLQEFAGYSLTVDTRLELAVWLYGPPGSGKSTLIEALWAALGPRAGVLGLADIQRSQFALADLPGKTLVVATEQPAEYIKSTDVLNAIISGEKIRVEQKYKPAYVVIPRAKILWAMNDLPRIKDANSGLFRRVKVVPFPKLDVKPDPAVKKQIKGEGPGILVWALEGLRRLRERGHFEIPEIVREATDEFRISSDVPRMFVEEACITSDADSCEEQAKVLYDWYRNWCLDNGHKPMSSTAIAKEWRRLGFSKRVLHGRTLYRGVKVDPGWIDARDESSRSL